jgi:hypothetical protein
MLPLKEYAMATGFEDYVIYLWSNPPLALDRVRQHLIALMGQQGARVGADWVTYDPSTLEKAIETARKDLMSLEGRVNNVGAPRAIMTRRVDPGPSVGLSY